MKTLLPVTLLALFLLGACEKERTHIKSSDIKDAAITVPKDCSKREKELSSTIFEMQEMLMKQQQEIDDLLASEQDLLKWKRDAMRRENERLKK